MRLHRIGVFVVMLAVGVGNASGQGSFTSTGSMSTGRVGHTATLLPNAKVLVAGGTTQPPGSPCIPGFCPTVSTATAEVYQVSTGTFVSTGSLTSPRDSHAAVLLFNGNVLLVGGSLSNCCNLATAELYNPSTGTFTATGSMSTPRGGPSATLLFNGKVLVAGGVNASVRLSSAELYDPATGTFSPTGSMLAPRLGARAILLANGKVLIAGGENSCVSSGAELYDPAAGTFTPTGNMTVPRANYTATELFDGTVLIAGGWSGCYGSQSFQANAEIYNPANGTFTPAGSMNTSHVLAVGSKLFTSQVFVAGGSDTPATLTTTSELYNPSTRTFAITGSMSEAHQQGTATLLFNGQVLVTGGSNRPPNVFLIPASATAELYTPGP